MNPLTVEYRCLPACVICDGDSRSPYLYLYDRGDGEPEAICGDCWEIGREELEP